MDFTNIDWEDIGQATLDTLTMTGCSLFFTILLGLPLGVLLFVTGILARACRSIFPLIVSGNAFNITITEGIIYIGKQF